MKAGTFVMTTLLLGLVAGGTYLVKPEVYEGILPDSMIGKKTPKKAKNKGKKKQQKKVLAAAEVVEKAEEVPAEAPAAEEDFDEPAGSAEQGSVVSGDWADCAKMKAAVAAEIMKKAKGKSTAELAKLFRKPKNQLLLAQWVVADAELRSQAEVEEARTESAARIEKLRKELEANRAKVPANAEPGAALAWSISQQETQLAKLEKEAGCHHLLSESAGDKAGSELMEMIGSDPEWMQDFAFSGECVRPGTALSILKQIHQEHPDMLENRMVRDIATATALEYAKSGWNQQDAVERANFYINAWKDDRLNTVFDTLPMWQRRMVCGCKGDNPYGSVSSLTWALENFHLPADRYSGSCWRCAYRLNNIYGDSIHGPMYYAPFESNLGDNREAMTYYVGGVCGSLSHFGAFAALANGVPAMTAGEPGHCAFIVLVGDKWTPAYSLSWQRGLHWQVFRSVHTFSSLHAATELFSDAQKKDTQKSDMLRVLGGIYADKGDLASAEDCFEKAAKAQPRNYVAMREWREVLEKAQDAGAANWNKLNDALCEYLVPLYPELASEHMHKGLADGLAANLKPKQLKKAYMKFWQSVKVMGPDRWRIEQLGNKQLAALGAEKDAAALCDFFSDVLGATVSNSEYAPAILSWGNELGSSLDKEGNAQLMQAIIKGIGKGGNMSADDRVKLLSPAILAAEKNLDRLAFQSIAKMIHESGYKNPDVNIPQIEPFPGKLASEGGLVWFSSTSQWDKPQDHAGLLTPQGGTFHTAKDEDAFVAVELPRQVQVTGIVLVGTPGNLHRCNNIRIQVSENGTDWTDVHDLGAFKQRVMRTDLGGKQPVAKYVRFLRQGGPDFFHLNGIFIYGNQAA